MAQLTMAANAAILKAGQLLQVYTENVALHYSHLSQN